MIQWLFLVFFLPANPLQSNCVNCETSQSHMSGAFETAMPDCLTYQGDLELAEEDGDEVEAVQ